MGFFSDLIEKGSLGLIDDPFGEESGAKAAQQAGQIQSDAALAGIEELRRQFGITQENFAPFLQAGQGALPFVQQGSTVQGLDQILSEILGSGAFESLIGERTRAVEGQLAAGGLTRSGAGIEAAADIPTDLAFMIEQLLTGRATNLAGSGQNAAGQLGAFSGNTSSGIASLFGQQGAAQASGILGAAQAGQQGNQAGITLLSALLSGA